jgi:NAD+--dinitrogen-reductase ADP-D-ribosyltransferase
MDNSDYRIPGAGRSNNMVGHATDLLAHVDFNDYPTPLHLSGVREMNKKLFAMLGLAESKEEAAEVFYNYMNAIFGIDPELWEQQKTKPGVDQGPVRRFKSSYLRLLKGWGFETCGPEGAVLKGWVESRFGLAPLYHKETIHTMNSTAWMDYLQEKMNSRFHNNAIYTQLDILYEFCQWSFDRFLPGETHLALYRGMNLPDGALIKSPGGGRQLRLNSLVSFSADREVASCFGDMVLTAKIPVCKIMFFNGLLPVHPLQGESEYMVIGGDYRVEASVYL